MNLKEKAKIYRDIWCCAYQRRHNAKVAGDLDRYEREQSTVLMSLRIAPWWKFDTDGKKFL